jgi:hypothetical protein
MLPCCSNCDPLLNRRLHFTTVTFFLNTQHACNCFVLGWEKNGYGTVSWFHISSVVHNSAAIWLTCHLNECTIYVAGPSPECRPNLWHKNSKQIIWDCGTVHIFGNGAKKSEFDSGRKKGLNSGNDCCHWFQNFCLLYFLKTIYLWFSMDMKLGLWHWGRNIVWGCLRTCCLWEYLDQRGCEVTGGWRKLHNEELYNL